MGTKYDALSAPEKTAVTWYANQICAQLERTAVTENRGQFIENLEKAIASNGVQDVKDLANYVERKRTLPAIRGARLARSSL